MTKPKDGGPAFPQANASKSDELLTDENGNAYWQRDSGMTLRQWYAGQAVSGWLASFREGESARPEDVANYAFEVADALIAEGEKE